MSIPRQVRLLARMAAVAALFICLIAGVGVAGLRRRARRIQALYDSVAIGDPWRGLDGFAERNAVSDPASLGPPERRYERRIMLPWPTSWQFVVDRDGRVAAKHRYD